MRHKVLLGFLGLSLAWMVAAAPGFAQPGTQPGTQPGDGFGPGFQSKFTEIKRSQLGPALGVDQRTVDRLIQMDQRYAPMKQQLIMQMRSELHRLEQVMSQSSPSEQEVNAILTKMWQLRKEKLGLEEKQDREEMALLTPVQRARYFFYLKSLVREAQSIKGSPGRPGGTSPITPGGPREIPVYRSGDQ
jgi:Spy/CpxP family protein refolding chaperone